MAVTDSTVARIDALNEMEEEQDEEEEDDKVSSVVVKLNFTSIQKDLKIKFTNKRTGKLIAGIPFDITLNTAKPADISLLSEEELSAELEKGFNQIAEGKVRSAKEAFADLYKKYDL